MEQNGATFIYLKKVSIKFSKHCKHYFKSEEENFLQKVFWLIYYESGKSVELIVLLKTRFQRKFDFIPG